MYGVITFVQLYICWTLMITVHTKAIRNQKINYKKLFKHGLYMTMFSIFWVVINTNELLFQLITNSIVSSIRIVYFIVLGRFTYITLKYLTKR